MFGGVNPLAALAAAGAVLITPIAASRAEAQTAPVVQPGIPGVLAAGASLELLRSGFNGTEGVIGMADGSVLFCEQNADRIIRIGLDGVFHTYLAEANRPIGLAFDSRGRLVAAQSRDPRVGALTPRRQVLADRFQGQPLVRPNDVVADAKGGIYISDPIPNPKVAFRAPPAGRKPLLFYLRPDGRLVKLTEAVTEPNGVALSPDGKVFYAVNGGRIDAFDVQPDGGLSRPRPFADVRGDGLAVDDDGRLYAATDAGVEVVAPDGRRLGLIPGPKIQSLAFAGEDRRDLYAVGQGSVYRVRMLASGIRSRRK